MQRTTFYGHTLYRVRHVKFRGASNLKNSKRGKREEDKISAKQEEGKSLFGGHSLC